MENPVPKMKRKRLKPKEKKIRGRPWFDGREEAPIIAEVKKAWSFGCSDREASVYAGISSFSLSRYIAAHPDLRYVREDLLESPSIQARMNVIKALQDKNSKSIRIETSRWYLERKHKDEFSTKQVLDHETPVPINLSAEALKRLQKVEDEE